MEKKIQKLLVANRGEIAIRVLRAANELKIRTVAVYTYEDRYSLHRYKADEAYQIGSEKEPLKPYLDIEEIINLAKKQKADAIHPGYGFLSENVQFARRCEEESIIFVGPSPAIMEQLGDKIAAKKIAKEARVPIIESSKVPLTSVETAMAEAEDIGYPVIIKASAGGGGRGMRVIRKAEELEKAFNEAKGEAGRAFGDDTIFLEKFIESPRHIEVQILGDRHGNIVHLFERDCSVQRRFQKIVEIAPAPTLKKETRTKLYGYALDIARRVGYNNAGTVEFLVDRDENVYFIEVNPRIQVEHTVTEQVTGIDLVRSQILIASDHPLSSSGIFIRSQEEIRCNGFAVQCRITTEDPENNFKPDYGTLIAYRNAGGFGIRIDEGSSYAGVAISPFFDSMLAKVTASGRTLKGAAQRLSRTLAEFRIRGVKTNIPFLENVITHPVFLDGKTTVRFIEDHPELFRISRRQDRGTRILKYLANVVVNGNPDVRVKGTVPAFETPKIPAFDKFGVYPKGTKQLLTEKGREEFCRWVKNSKEIHYTDTTFRDAHQSLIATRVRTIDMLRVAEAFAKSHSQVFSMEVWGGATFDVAMRFLHECPWKRLQQFREAIPNTLLQMLLRGANAVGYSAYPDNLVEKFIEKSWENGIDIFRIFDSLNWPENMKVAIKAVQERTGAISEACICYTGDISDLSRKKYTLQYYLDLARELEDAGTHILAIKDMAGLLKPQAATRLVTELKKVIDIPIHLHTHDTSSAQLATYLNAIDAGVDIVDAAIGSMSGMSSQPNFNTLLEIMKGNARERKFDIHSMNEFSDYWEAVRKYYFPFESDLRAGAADVYVHEIPGGQYSNLKAQAASLGLGDKMDRIKRAYREVNDLFGDIVKVTPSSKVVGDMALFMVSNNLTAKEVMEKGERLSFPESVKSFFKGELGQPAGGFPPLLQQAVLRGETPISGRPNGHLKSIDFEKDLEAFRLKFDRSLSLLDFISYCFYPKVFEEFYRHRNEYGDVAIIPTPAFLYGMKNNQEVLIEISEGKNILVRLLYISDPDDSGKRTVYFKLNGQTRGIEVKDSSLQSVVKVHRKVISGKEIGTPLQGMLSRVFVKEGDAVIKNAPLFTIEAMKMESTITASSAGRIKKIHLDQGTLVETDDLIVELE